MKINNVYKQRNKNSNSSKLTLKELFLRKDSKANTMAKLKRINFEN